VSTGRSRDNWVFDAVWRRSGTDAWNTDELIARRDPEGGLLETDRAVEFEILKALTKSNLTTPAPRWLDATGEELGRPCLIMTRLPGTCDYYALSSGAPMAERVNLAGRLCTLMSDVHSVDWQAIGPGATLTDPGPGASKAALAEWEAVLHRDQMEPYPELALAAQWLRKQAPRSPRTVLVHADFKVGNVLTEDGNIVALLDWELAHLGDPHEDLGWVTQPLRKREHFIPGTWERRELLDHYQRVSGLEVDHDAVLWWNVFAAYKTAVMQASGLRAFTEGRSEDFYQPSAPVLTLLLDQVLA
jgi:aminoglycoside phosphotransferase (APT) family kinase protein